MAKKTLLLIVILLLTAFGLLYLAFAPANKSKEVATVATPFVSPLPTPTPSIQTVLTLSPNPLVIASPSGSLTLSIDTGENKVNAIQFELLYNPQVLTNVEILQGSFFENPITLLKNIDVKSGKVSYVLATPPNGKAKSGRGVIATLKFTTKLASGEKTDITFSPKTLVTAEKIQTSVLKTAEKATVFYVQQGGQQQTGTTSGQVPIGPVRPTNSAQ